MGRRPKEQVAPFPDVDAMTGRAEKKPLTPIKFELFANEIVRNGGNVARAAEINLDPLEDPNYTTFEELPPIIQERVKFLLKRKASDTVATRREVEETLTFALRGDKERGHNIHPIDAARELCKMNGWYSPVEVKTTNEIIVPRQIAEMSDDKLRRIAMLTANEQPKAIDAEVIEVDAEKEKVNE